jgi:hypothetical protein
VPLILVFLLYSRISKIGYIKIRSLGMALVILLGLNTALINFFLKDFFRLHPLIGDFSFGFFSLFLFFLLIYFSFQAEGSEEKMNIGE